MASSFSVRPSRAAPTACFRTEIVRSYTLSGTGNGWPSLPPWAREARGIGEAAGSAVEHLGDRGERLDRAGADTGLQEELGEVARRRFASRRERAMQAADEDVG